MSIPVSAHDTGGNENLAAHSSQKQSKYLVCAINKNDAHHNNLPPKRHDSGDRCTKKSCTL